MGAALCQRLGFCQVLGPSNTIRTMTERILAESRSPLAVLVSGGLDSAILLGEAVDVRPAIYPIYIRTGAAWEDTELDYLRRFLKAIEKPSLRTLVVLHQPVADLYGDHWSLTGKGIPGAETPDEAVYLPGRNVLLLAKALIWCHLHSVPEVALAPLSANPFPDATPEFFLAFQRAVNQAISGNVQIAWPYLHLTKADVLMRGAKLPLQHTFSCIRPTGGKHCGTCNKCAERRRAFRSAGISDPTQYGT